jgi:hypothetical protein
MADFWIVSRKKYARHKTFGEANAERERGCKASLRRASSSASTAAKLP